MLSLSYNFTSVKRFELRNVHTKEQFAFPAVGRLWTLNIAAQQVFLPLEVVLLGYNLAVFIFLTYKVYLEFAPRIWCTSKWP